jgi:hypothetical protein
VKDKAEPVEPQKKPAVVDTTPDVQAVTFSTPDVVEKKAPEPEVVPDVVGVPVQQNTTITATSYIEADPVEPVSSPNMALRAMALTSTLAAVDPARAAYIKQFTDADPNNLYFTPGSPGYVAPTPSPLTDAQYSQFVVDYVATKGTSGFSQTSTGALQYTNTNSQNVAVLYGSKAAGFAEPSGIRIVRPGQTVVLPSGAQGAVASAQLPRTGTQINEVAVAAVGYPPFTKTGSGSSSPIPTYPSPSPLITQINSILSGNSFNDVVNYASDLAAVFGFSAVNKALSFVGAALTGYSGNPGAVAGKVVQALGTVISTNAANLSRVPGLGFASGIVYAAGAVVTTYGYVAEQASYIDPNSVGTTTEYIKNHPAVAVQELAKASVKVAVDLGSAFIGSLGGVFKIFG